MTEHSIIGLHLLSDKRIKDITGTYPSGFRFTQQTEFEFLAQERFLLAKEVEWLRAMLKSTVNFLYAVKDPD